MRNWIINTLLIAAFALAVAISGDKPKPQPTSYEEPTTTEILTTTEEPSTKPEIMTTTQQTTTAVPITTTVHPTLPPTPNITTWSVTQGNSTCILLEAGIRMTFNYVNYTDDETPDTNITNFNIDVPADAKASGTCGEVEQTITLKFFETFHSDGWFLTLVFKKGDTAKKYYMSDIMFNYEISPDQFPGAKKEREADYYANETVKPFNVDENKHYSCVHQNLLAYNKSAIYNGVIEVSAYNLNVEAFRTKSGGGFSSGNVRCSADEVSQLVPIVVGAVLAGLIVIVLIAYLIGRRRSRRGYESV